MQKYYMLIMLIVHPVIVYFTYTMQIVYTKDVPRENVQDRITLHFNDVTTTFLCCKKYQLS